MHLFQQKAPIYKSSRSKAPKHNEVAVTDIQQKQEDFFNDPAQASTLAPAII